MPSKTYLDHLNNKKANIIDKYERSLAAIKDLTIGECTKFRVGPPWTDEMDSHFVGSIVDLREGKVIIKLIAAEKIDYKARKVVGTKKRHRPKRHYPISLELIKSTEPIELAKVPLLINYNYISEQFKNRYLR